ncbi:MAG: PHP domain-containing protein [Candidatus Melainabacteria bacterium]|nr:PHP domain-containing protein [Candidatus Melainabacteria bacterium]
MSGALHDKYEIAHALRETGLLLNVLGDNPYKAKAYLQGAKAIEGANEDIGTLIREDRLTELSGIGESLASSISDLYKSGETRLLSKLRKELPQGTAELSQIRGLTLARIKTLTDIGIDSKAKLLKACKAGTVAKLKGFGIKVQRSILDKLENAGQERHQMLLVDALDIANELVSDLKSSLKTQKVELVGQMRRFWEAVDKIEIAVEATSSKIQKALEHYHGLGALQESSDKKCLVARHIEGLNIEIYPVRNLALAMVAFSGSQEHFSKLQEYASKNNFKLLDCSFKKNREEIEIANEEDVFKYLGLNFIPPELREGQDEIEEAIENDFKDLVNIEDIQGMTHCHSTYSDGIHSIEKMARHAKKMGKKYMTLTDHSPAAHYAGGLSVDRLKEQWQEIDRVQELLNFKILKGTECDILADGRLDYPDNILEKFDVIIASIHTRYRQNEEAMTKRLLRGLKNPHFKIWGHPLGRLVLKRDPVPCDVEKVLEAIADARVAIEINGDPYRLDLAPQWAKIARKLGLKFIISTDAHSISNYQNLKFGIHMARRAGICKDEVLNTLSVQKFKNIVKPA